MDLLDQLADAYLNGEEEFAFFNTLYFKTGIRDSKYKRIIYGWIVMLAIYA